MAGDVRKEEEGEAPEAPCRLFLARSACRRGDVGRGILISKHARGPYGARFSAFLFLLVFFFMSRRVPWMDRRRIRRKGSGTQVPPRRHRIDLHLRPTTWYPLDTRDPSTDTVPFLTVLAPSKAQKVLKFVRIRELPGKIFVGPPARIKSRAPLTFCTHRSSDSKDQTEGVRPEVTQKI
jgi:hypothetical protein